MRCPHCGADDDRVVDSRPAEDHAAVRRRRHCQACQQRFSTYERAEQVGLMVRKRDGELEPYERQKVLDGMRRALGSDVDGGTVRHAAEQVESRLRRLGQRHVPSTTVGTEVVDALRAVSPPAAIRFASVHERFTSTADFRRVLADLETPDAASTSVPPDAAGAAPGADDEPGGPAEPDERDERDEPGGPSRSQQHGGSAPST